MATHGQVAGRAPLAGKFRQLVAFVRDGLLDPRARPERLRHLVPAALPSGRPVHQFQFDAGR